MESGNKFQLSTAAAFSGSCDSLAFAFHYQLRMTACLMLRTSGTSHQSLTECRSCGRRARRALTGECGLRYRGPLPGGEPGRDDSLMENVDVAEIDL